MITGKIDVSKIDKTKLYQGKTAKFLDIVLIPKKDDKYGDDYMIVQGLPKAERDAGNRGAILGNAKIMGQKPGFGGGQAARRPEPTDAQKSNTDNDNDPDSVPF